MTILVTGATGFVGRVLVARLADEGRTFRVASRRASAEPAQSRAPEIVVGDLAQPVDWGPALDGVDTVLHLAGRAHVLGREAQSDDSFMRVNVDATRDLARAAAAAGVRRFVFLSSAKVMGEESSATGFRETDTPHPVGPYATSKLLAERAALDVARDTGLSVVVVRSPLVYGPGVRANFLALIRAVDRGIPLPFGAVNNARSVIAVDNLVDALLACADAPRPKSDVYFAKDEPDLSTPDLIRAIAHALRRPARLIPIPPALLRLGGRILGRDDTMVRLIGTSVVDSSRIRADLAWHPPLSSTAALDATIRWYRSA